jgi:hypothetical protein
MVTYLAHHMLPYDIPVIPGGQGLKLDEIRGRAEYFTSASVEALVGHYREVAPELGWTAQAGADQVRADGASLYVQDENDLGFGIEIARKDDQTRVSIIRLSFAKDDDASPSQTPAPDATAVAIDEATTPETSSVLDDAENDLQKEIEDTVRKQLESVQEQLKNLDGEVDLSANILQGVLDDATEEASLDEDTAADEADEEADADKQQAAAMRAADQALASLDKLATGCTVHYGNDRFELKNALALRSPEDGSPVLIFCQQPLDVGRAQRALAKGESVSMLDVTGNQFPPAAEIRLHSEYISINCFVDGTSISRGSTEFESDYLAGTRRVRGSVSMNEAEQVFDKSFRFEMTFDQEFLEAAKPNTPGNSIDQLVADSNYELPVPEGCGQVSQGRSPYRTAIDAQIDLPLTPVLAFYRRELAGRGFRESPNEAPPNNTSAKLTFASGDGPLTLTLRQVGQGTQIELAQRHDTKAKQDKLVPAPGQGLLLLANAGDAEVVVTLNKRTIKLPAGKGANDPKDAVKIPVMPGKHRVSVAAGGDTHQEELAIEAGTAWGLIALPGGGSLAQILY